MGGGVGGWVGGWWCVCGWVGGGWGGGWGWGGGGGVDAHGAKGSSSACSCVVCIYGPTRDCFAAAAPRCSVHAAAGLTPPALPLFSDTHRALGDPDFKVLWRGYCAGAVAACGWQLLAVLDLPLPGCFTPPREPVARFPPFGTSALHLPSAAYPRHPLAQHDPNVPPLQEPRRLVEAAPDVARVELRPGSGHLRAAGQVGRGCPHAPGATDTGAAAQACCCGAGRRCCGTCQQSVLLRALCDVAAPWSSRSQPVAGGGARAAAACRPPSPTSLLR